MKKLYASMFSLSVFASAYAQTQITASNIPVPTDVYNFHIVTSGYGTSAGTAGTGQTWNFTGLVAGTTPSSRNFLTPSSTPDGTSFPSSTVAQQDTTAYSYYTGSSSSYQLDGMTINTGGFSAVLVLSDPGVIYNTFPFGMGNTHTDNVSGNAQTSFGAIPVTGTVTTTVDGTGTLQLPGTSYSNVIRVKMETNLDVMSGTFTVNDTRYLFYNATQKFPLLEYAFVDMGGQLDTMVILNSIAYVGMNELAKSEFSIYPNPAKNVLHISAGADLKNGASAEVINQLGQTVREFKVTDGVGKNISLDLNGIASGVYFVKLKNEGQSSVKKFIVE